MGLRRPACALDAILELGQTQVDRVPFPHASIVPTVLGPMLVALHRAHCVKIVEQALGPQLRDFHLKLAVHSVQQEHGRLMLGQRILQLALTAAQGLGPPPKVLIRLRLASNAMKERGQL